MKCFFCKTKQEEVLKAQLWGKQVCRSCWNNRADLRQQFYNKIQRGQNVRT